MIQTPCEYMRWQGLPAIRKQIVKSMMNKYGLNQKEAAEKMGITPAAVCQYLSSKRGIKHIENKTILTEINHSADEIINNGKGSVQDEICRICKLLREEILEETNKDEVELIKILK